MYPIPLLTTYKKVKKKGKTYEEKIDVELLYFKREEASFLYEFQVK